jgi:hypothetical protein
MKSFDLRRSARRLGMTLGPLLALPLWLAGLSPALAQGVPFLLPAGGCPMAHCDARMSDQVGMALPASAQLIRVDTAPVGGAGLGCVSSLRTVACTYRGDPAVQSNLVVYDANGQRIWQDGGQLGVNAWASAAIIGTDDHVIAADDAWVMRVDPIAGQVVWKSAKPDSGVPISPVLVGSDQSMVFVATNSNPSGGTAGVSVWDAGSGALLAHQPIVDPISGRVYVTRNTVAVRGDRAYVLAAAEVDPTDARMVAIDVCNASSCGGRGAMSVAWTYEFKGPSGASPLLIGNVLYFDGRPGNRVGSFMALADRGSSARRLWVRYFGSNFGVSAAQDPRGGLWVHPSSQSQSLLRLNATTGVTDQEVIVSDLLGAAAGYLAQSVVSVYSSDAGAVALVFGALKPGQSNLPTYLVAADVSSTPAGSLLWAYQVSPTPADNAAVGQFPLVVNAAGARRIVFNGSKSMTYFVGEP